MGEKTTRMSRKKKKTYEPEIMLERMSTNARREYIDRNDRLFDNNNTKDFFQDYVLNKPDINIKFIYMDNIEKGFGL